MINSRGCDCEEFEKKIRADERRKFAEWLAEVEKVSEPNKEDTINRWLEDFAKWKKGAG